MVIQSKSEKAQYRFVREATLLAGVLLFLLALQLWHLPQSGNRAIAILQEEIAQAAGRNLVGVAGGGYYENLMGAKGAGLEIKPMQWLIRGKFPHGVTPLSIYRDAEFVGYAGKPNLRDLHPDEQPIAIDTFGYTEGPIETNSYGFFDREHSLNKPAGTRRVAILGDSLTRGWGLPMQDRYTSLLEKQLNDKSGEKFEVLNFAVTAYTMTQIYDVALEEASHFHPDVYILAVTPLTASTTWGSHIARLVQENRDLKYDFIRDVVHQSGLSKDDSPDLSNWKLAPYREATLREILLRLQTFVHHQDAQLLVVIVPSVEDQDILALRLRPLDTILKGTSIPVVDVSDSFKGGDIDGLRLNWHDVHPNAHGNQIIADNLYEKLRENPATWEAVTGESLLPVVEQAAAGRR
jgi:lysophospholipase L1-like esterase